MQPVARKLTENVSLLKIGTFLYRLGFNLWKTCCVIGKNVGKESIVEVRIMMVHGLANATGMGKKHPQTLKPATKTAPLFSANGAQENAAATTETPQNQQASQTSGLEQMGEKLAEFVKKLQEKLETFLRTILETVTQKVSSFIDSLNAKFSSTPKEGEGSVDAATAAAGTQHVHKD